MDVIGVTKAFRKFLVFAFIGLVSGLVIADVAKADVAIWTDVGDLKQKGFELVHQKGRYLKLNAQALRGTLASELVSEAISNSTQVITLPLSNGSMQTVSIVPDSVLSKRLAKQYKIQTYRILPDDEVVGGRADYSVNGFHAMLQMRSGGTFLIDPKSHLNNRQSRLDSYISYKKQDQIQTHQERYSCGVKASTETEFKSSAISSTINSSIKKRSTDGSEKSLLSYKIAIAATGEYVAKKGGTVEGALAGIVTTLNRVNHVYEQDLGIHLQLIDKNDALIYTDASTDPYSGSDLNALIRQNQNNLDDVIGSENYDIGHLFTTQGGGLSFIGGVCDQNRKGQGISGIGNPSNDSFNLDFVAHEIGHQLGATHTFNGVEGLCSSSARTARTAFEPGSGSTIMSYAGYCGVDNLQSNSDAMFHIGSINQIRDFTTNDRGNRCGIRRQVQNTPPIVNAGSDYKIPAQTPFELQGTANDSDGDQLVFAWEQIDSGEQSQPNSDTGDNALFRVHFPSDKKSRSFPPIDNILNHATAKGELLPIQQRSLNFSFVAQDGFNAAQSDEMSIDVLRTGSRFALNMPRTSYTRGDTHKIYWNTANTEKPPINCDAVDIYLSHDGGRNFQQKLATAVENTGESWVTIPADFPVTNTGRLKLRCSNNIFFAVSYRNFVVNKQGDEIRAIFSDEDQPEPSLRDRAVGESSFVQTQELNSQTSSAGGSFGFLFLYFSLLFFFKRLKLVGTIIK